MSNKHISEKYEFRNIKQNEAEEAAEIERICFPPNFGFKDKGIAQSTWGGEEWHEMSTIKPIR